MSEHREAPHGGAVVRDHRGVHNDAVVVRDRGWRGDGGRVVVRGGGGWGGGGRVVVRGGGRPYYHNVVRRPIFVSRPIIRGRYYNYYQRPQLIVESYNTMPGYYWVSGSWTWNGYEWIWQPGHYQPDPNYIDSGYYDSSY